MIFGSNAASPPSGAHQGLLGWLPSPTLHLLLSISAVLIYIVSTRTRRERRAPATAIAWVIALVTLPYVVLPLYLLFGQRKVRPATRPRAPRHHASMHWGATLLEGFGVAPPSWCEIELHRDGSVAREALWHVIDCAQERLDICTFIIGHDALGDEVIHRLAARARAGVQVRVMLDGFGALSLSRSHFDTLRKAGGKVTIFRPLLRLRSRGRGNLRNHRKMVVADDTVMWSGGRNLAAEYFTGTVEAPAWLDLSFTIRGGVAAAAAHQFEQDWSAMRRQPARIIARPPALSHGSAAQFLPSGPDQQEDTAHGLLIAACFRAERRILAVTPYFVPDERLRAALHIAAVRGVEVTIVLPAHSNHALADFARARALRDLAHSGVRFLLHPAMVHAKAVVIDDDLATCGSINLDQRSLLLNHEANVVFYSAADIAWLAEWIDHLAQACVVFEPRPASLTRDLSEGLLLAVAFQL